MRALKSQYFLSYAVFGSLLPFFPAYLRQERHLSDVQVGYVLTVANLVMLLTPVVVTWLADARVDPRRIMAGLLLLCGLTTATLAAPGGLPVILALYAVQSLAFAPVMPLQDGINFALQHQRTERGEAPVPYHRIRVWGTIGFILPGLLLFIPLRAGQPLSWILVSCAVFCGLALVNTFRLADPRGERGTPGGLSPARGVGGTSRGLTPCATPDLAESAGPPNAPSPLPALAPVPHDDPAAAAERRDVAVMPDRALHKGSVPIRSADSTNGDRPRGALPTAAAARALLEPHVLVFCLAMALVWMASAAYYAFYPIYLRESVGVGNQWLGPIANLGQLVEIAFMLAFGWLAGRIGLKWLMALGVTAMAVRFALLAAWPVPGIAVGTQLFHGLMVLVIHVVPPVFLNSHAAPAYRNSIQGLFAMAVASPARIVGSLLAGYIAHASLAAAFWYAAGLCVVAAGLFAFAFTERKRGEERGAKSEERQAASR